MGRNRVLSFMSTLSGGGSNRESRTPSPPADSAQIDSNIKDTESSTERFPEFPASPARNEYAGPVAADTQTSTPGRQRSSSRPLSMIQTYQPHVMDTLDTIPELQPVFTLLNNHGNKLYQEGYFLKLDDQNTQGRPNPDRNWTECFAQLVGTVLSIWDAAELDATGKDGEVLPKFINLTDASIKVIDALPTRSTTERPLQNVLSVSTAGRNRYLLHFNSHHSLIQWTAGIRLAMYEHSTLQEAYTGALIAGKGRSLNNINLIMSPAKFKTEEWVRVRFGAGVPWRRCWCVISPPDEKEVAKLQKDMKKRSPYDRSHAPVLRGDIKFYDTRKEGKKQKKAKPIATITNSYSAYAIYPQSKALIDASSLIKLEGTIVIHSDPVSTTEGFVFMMPEVPNAVSGFEMLLRFLFPIWDVFALYGRPSRLVASTLDPRSLMFAMPKHRRYGYLELMDVSTLVLTDGSAAWNERDWRKKLKDLTAKRMSAMEESASSGADSARNSRRNSKRLSFGQGVGQPTAGNIPASNSMGTIAADRPARPRVGFADSSERPSRPDTQGPPPALRNDSAPPASDRQRIPSSMAQAAAISRNRVNSESQANGPYAPPRNGPQDPAGNPPGYFPNAMSTPPPAHIRGFVSELATTPERVSSEDGFSSRNVTPPQDLSDMHQRLATPEPVRSPPSFHHPPSSRPAAGTPYHSPELRRANSRLSNTTLAQIVNANANTSGNNMPLPMSMSDMSLNDSRPGSQGSNRGFPGAPVSNTSNPSLAPSSLSASPSASSPGPGMHTPSSTAPLAYSKSPLNQAHNAGPGPGPGPGPALAPAPTFTENKALPPRVPVPMADRFAPSHMHDVVRPIAQGPTPFNAQNTQNAQNAQNANILPYRPPTSSSTPPPARLRTPPPQAANPLSPNNTSPPINRKPVPTRADSVQGYKGSAGGNSGGEPQSAQSAGSGSMQGYYIDEDALAKVPFGNAASNSGEPQRVVRQDTKMSETSRYDEYDASSTTSPDYASTHESVHSNRTQESVERPRAGVLRTVGDTSVPAPPKEDLAIPEVNFGPTYNYAAANLPRNKTPTPLAAPAAAPATAKKDHTRQESDDTIRRRSVAWQPGGSMLGPSAGNDRSPSAGGLTPEQFVMQRAQASTPVYHQRVPSNNSLLNIRKNSPSPSGAPTATAIRRRSSFDMLSNPPNPQYQQQQRPSSQGAGAALGSHARNASGNVGSHLSAREQEHLARATGSPLINMAANSRGNQDGAGGPGLVGAIAAREREKQQMREGVSSHAVQYAINQRQQQAQQQAQQQQQQQHMYYMQQQQQQMQMHMQQQAQQQQYNQMYGAPSPSYSGYQLPPGHGPPGSRPQPQMQMQMPMGSPQMGMPGGWPGASSPQPQQQQQQQQQQYMQGYPQQYAGSQYAASQMAPRARTPGANPMLHNQPGQAF